MTEPAPQNAALDTATALTGLLALAAAARDDAVTAPEDRRRTEVVLSDAGLTLGQIAVVTGRKYETVKTTLRRAKAAQAAPKRRTTGTRAPGGDAA